MIKALLVFIVSAVAVAGTIDTSKDGVFLSRLDNGEYLVVYRLVDGHPEHYKGLMGKAGKMKSVEVTLNSISSNHMEVDGIAVINVSINGVARNLTAVRGETAIASMRDLTEWAALQAGRPHLSKDVLYIKEGLSPDMAATLAAVLDVPPTCRVAVKKVTDEVKKARYNYYQNKFDRMNGFK